MVLAVNFSRRVPVQRLMTTDMVVILLECFEFSFKIRRIPKGDTVKVLPPNRSNQSLDEGMRYRDIWDGLNLLDPKNSQVGLPSVILE